MQRCIQNNQVALESLFENLERTDMFYIYTIIRFHYTDKVTTWDCYINNSETSGNCLKVSWNKKAAVALVFLKSKMERFQETLYAYSMFINGLKGRAKRVNYTPRKPVIYLTSTLHNVQEQWARTQNRRPRFSSVSCQISRMAFALHLIAPSLHFFEWKLYGLTSDCELGEGKSISK